MYASEYNFPSTTIVNGRPWGSDTLEKVLTSFRVYQNGGSPWTIPTNNRWPEKIKSENFTTLQFPQFNFE